MPQGKLEHLRSILRETGGALVAFSSGADSTFLLRVAHDTLGDRAVAATVRSAALPAHESEEAARFCRDLGIRHEFVDIDIAGMPGFAENGPDRCYLCKKELFIRLAELATRLGLAVVAEGSNTDDEADFRPGLRAIAELGVRSPLREAGFTKPEIRALSREMGLPTWDKAASACLASRFPYGETITRAGLERVERAERFLTETLPELRQSRVRSHGDIARIEVPADMMAATAARAEEISEAFTGLGFRYTALDLRGYRTGSMNEALSCGRIAAATGLNTRTN